MTYSQSYMPDSTTALLGFKMSDKITLSLPYLDRRTWHNPEPNWPNPPANKP